MYKRLWDAECCNTCSTSSPIDSDRKAVPFMDKVMHRLDDMKHIQIYHSVLRTPSRTRFVPFTWFWSRITPNILGSKLLAGLAVLVTCDAIRGSLGSTMEARWGEVSPTNNITKSVPYDAARRSTTTRTALALCNSWKESLEVLEKWINMTDCAKDCSDDVDIFSKIGDWYRD